MVKVEEISMKQLVRRKGGWLLGIALLMVSAVDLDAAPTRPPAAVSPPPQHQVAAMKFRLAGPLGEGDAMQVAMWASGVIAQDPATAILEIDSPGGEVTAGHTIAKIIDMMAERGHPVTCIVDGTAASAAFYILQACPVRVMTKRSRVMTHHPRAMMPVYLLPPADMELAVRLVLEDLRVTADGWAEHCSARLKISKAEYLRHVDHNTDWYMTWADALKVGAVDRVVDTLNAEQERLTTPPAPKN